MSWNRSRREKEKLARLYEETKNGYGKGAYFSERKNRIVKIQPSRHTKMMKYHKRQGAKFARRYCCANRGCAYKKCYDIWWQVW